MNKIKFKVIPTGNEDNLFIADDKLTEIISEHFSYENCDLRRSTGVLNSRNREIYEGDWAWAYCKTTGEEKEGHVYFKDGSFFIEDVCFPYLRDFEL